MRLYENKKNLVIFITQNISLFRHQKQKVRLLFLAMPIKKMAFVLVLEMISPAMKPQVIKPIPLLSLLVKGKKLI